VIGAMLVLIIEVAGEGDESVTFKLECVFSRNTVVYVAGILCLGLEGGVRADTTCLGALSIETMACGSHPRC